MPPPRAAVFLDRDDTILDTRAATAHTSCPGDLVDPALVRLLPGAAQAIRRLNDAGLLVVVVSNQGAVARGTPVPLLHHPLTSINTRPCTLADIELVNQRMRDLLLAEAGARIDAIYTCPYHPRGTVAPFNTDHPWRKPAPGMLLAAANDHDLDLARSWMIGDAQRDIDAALAAGISRDQALLVGTTGSANRTILGAANFIVTQVTGRPAIPKQAATQQ